MPRNRSCRNGEVFEFSRLRRPCLSDAVKVLSRSADKSIEKGKKRGGVEMNITSVEKGGAMQVFSAAAASSHGAVARADDGGGGAASGEQVRRMAKEIESQLQRMNVSLEFSRYGDHGEKIAVVVANKSTGEVIRQIPSEEIQHLYNSINNVAGIIFDGRA
jgi:flagellar protein FlaG